MINLRPSLREDILRDLDNNHFGKGIFNLRFQEEDFLIYVEFLPNRKFSLKLIDSTDKSNPKENYTTIESPGQWILEPEEFCYENFGQAKSRIASWAHRIEADFKASKPDDGTYQDLREQILSQFKKYEAREGEYFSEKEKIDVHATLEELKKKIESLYKEKEATNQQLNLMRQQINKLNEGIEILDKRTWLMAAANRVINIFKEVKAAVGEVNILTNDINKLLLQETGNTDEQTGE